MAKIPKAAAEELESELQKCLSIIEKIEDEHGDECKMEAKTAYRIRDILDGIGSFLENSLQ